MAGIIEMASLLLAHVKPLVFKVVVELASEGLVHFPVGVLEAVVQNLLYGIDDLYSLYQLLQVFVFHK